MSAAAFDTPADIARAQFALDHYPQDSAFWDSGRGQEALGIIADHNLTATTTAEYCREWERDQMRAARSAS